MGLRKGVIMFIQRHDVEESYIGIILSNTTICEIIELATLGNKQYKTVLEDSIHYMYIDCLGFEKEEPEDASSERG